LPASSYLRV